MVDAILIKHKSSRAAPIRPAHILALRERYPTIEEITIEPPLREDPTHYDESYPWAEAITVHERGHKAVLDAQERHPDAALVYMGYIPIPLAVHLGTLFGQLGRIEVLPYDRERDRWGWTETEATPGLMRELPSLPPDPRSDRDVLVRVSCSQTVAPARTRALGERPHEIDVAIAQAGRNVLRSQADVEVLARGFRQALDDSIDAYPGARVRHLAAAVPVIVAFAMGRQISRSMHLPIQTWKFLGNRERAYARAVCIGKYQPLPGALFLGASPIGVRAISAAAEVQSLCDLLKPHGDRVRVEGRPAAGVEDLTQTLKSFDPRIVHIACHGHAGYGELGPRLTLSTPQGYATEIELDDLLRLLRRGPKIECVVLAACESAPVAKRLVQAVPTAVGFHRELYDDDARAFGYRFWSSLIEGHSVRQSFADAELSIDVKRRGNAELYTREGLDDELLIPIAR